jgi:hypothetical protein
MHATTMQRVPCVPGRGTIARMDAIGVTFAHLREAVQSITGESGTVAVCGHVATMQDGVVVSVAPAPRVDARRDHSYAIVFRQHNDAPNQFKLRWKNLLAAIATNPNRVIAEWIEKLQSGADGVHEDDTQSLDTPPRASDLVLLKRAEGGIGGGDNRACRQIRFGQMVWRRGTPWDYGEITLCARQSWDGTDTWTLAELRVYRDTFSEVIVDHLGTHAHEKRIEVDFVLR